MSNNFVTNPASGGATFVSEDIAGVQLPVVKVAWGDVGVQKDVTTTAPLPVDLTNTGANTTAIKVDGSAVTQPISGDVGLNQYTPLSGRLPVDGSGVTQPVSAVSLPLPTNAATETGNLATLAATTDSQQYLLTQILLELRTITYYLATGLNVRDEPQSVREGLSPLQ